MEQTIRLLNQVTEGDLAALQNLTARATAFRRLLDGPIGGFYEDTTRRVRHDLEAAYEAERAGLRIIEDKRACDGRCEDCMRCKGFLTLPDAMSGIPAKAAICVPMKNRLLYCESFY